MLLSTNVCCVVLKKVDKLLFLLTKNSGQKSFLIKFTASQICLEHEKVKILNVQPIELYPLITISSIQNLKHPLHVIWQLIIYNKSKFNWLTWGNYIHLKKIKQKGKEWIADAFVVGPENNDGEQLKRASNPLKTNWNETEIDKTLSHWHSIPHLVWQHAVLTNMSVKVIDWNC